MENSAPPKLMWLSLPLGIWAVFVTLFALDVATRIASLDSFVGADMASAYNLAMDVVKDPAAILDWTLPSANYLFPDLLMLVPFALAGWHFDEAIPLYGAISLFIFLVGSYALARHIASGFDAIAATTLTMALAGSLLLIGDYPGQLIAAPNFHGSIAILGPSILAAACGGLRAVSGGRRWNAAAAVAAVLLGALSFSDRLTMIAITVPLCGSLVLFAALHPRDRSAAMWLAILFASVSLTAVLLDVMWRPDNPGAAVAPSPTELWANLQELYNRADGLRANQPWLFYGALASPLLALGGLAAQLGHRTETPQEDAWLLLLGYVAIYYPLIMIVHAASTLEPTLHYRLADLTLACVFLPLLRPFARFSAPAVGNVVAIAAAVAAVVYAAILAPGKDRGVAHVLPYVRCLDELAKTRGLHYGAAEYWDAIPVRPLSRNEITVVSVGPDLRPRRWNQTLRIDEREPYDFLVSHKNFGARTYQLLPPVRDTAQCDGRRIYILRRD